MQEYIQVCTTVEKREDADKVAKALLEGRLAACVQIVGPIVSHYWWKGRLLRADEWQCLIKTRRSLYPRIEKAIKAIHPYETPEVIALPIVGGSSEYLEWLSAETKDQ